MQEVLFEMQKIGRLQDGQWREFSFEPVYNEVCLKNGTQRIVAGVPQGDSDIFDQLAESLQPPFFLLYVLHTPRGEAETGRYESPALSLSKLQEFLRRFRAFLAADGRFDLWIHSREDNATLVWDRHNLLYAYGPLEKIASKLRAMSFRRGDPQIPFPHSHYYRSEMDEDAEAVVAALDWIHKPLRPEDEQLQNRM